MKIYDFKVENQVNPLGLDIAKPVFSWKLSSGTKNTMQQKFDLGLFCGNERIWTSSFHSSESVGIVYNGETLLPFKKYRATLFVTDNNGNTAESELSFETGKLGNEFAAKFIAPKDCRYPVFALNKYVDVSKPVIHARLYATALGLYEFYINNKKTGDLYFAPYWTDYRHTLEYQTYDVTEMLVKGKNNLSMFIGKGWYAGALGYAGEKENYGSRTAGMAELHITYNDGTKEIICTDESWTAENCYITDSEFYYGEQQDFTCDTEQYDVERLVTPNIRIVGQRNEPVRCTQELKTKDFITTPKGEFVVDFGQNMVGFVRLNLCGKAGQKIQVGHAEILDKEGNFYTENLRSAKSVDTYILSGGKQEIQPHFTFHGFRYVRIEGAEINKEDITALVVHSDMKRTGRFVCSDERINQLQSNIVWGQRGNFVDVPTDCPQRDERLGWTGDANVFFRTAAFNYDVSLFFDKWLKDLITEQSLDGNVPHVIPNTQGVQAGAALWSDCATMIPWYRYLVYGNTRDLGNQLLSMKMWADYVRSKCGPNKLWQSGFQYGDWLALDSGNTESRSGVTDKYFIANVFYYVSTRIVALAAKAVNDLQMYEDYLDRQEEILKAIRNEYVTATGRLVSETQTACALALYFDIIPKKYRGRVMDSLINNLAGNRNHLNTGFAGTPFLLFALSENGAHDLATKLLFNDDYPSWLYAVKHGATTIWERWNGILPDGTPYDPAMNSFNHYSYGSVGDFLYRKVAGLECAAPGYRKIKISPTLTKGLEYACVEFESVYGKIVSGYECKNGKIKVFAEIPCNTTAEIILPESKKRIKAGSGSYVFEYATSTDLSVKHFTMDSVFGNIVVYKEAGQFLEQIASGIFDGPLISFAMNMTLTEVCAYSGAEGAKLFEALIEYMNGLYESGVIS